MFFYRYFQRCFQRCNFINCSNFKKTFYRGILRMWNQTIYIYMFPISHIYKVLYCINSVTCNWKWRVLSLFKFRFVYSTKENYVCITMVSVNNRRNLVLMENHFWLFLITLHCSLTRIVELVIVSCNWNDLDIICELISKLQLRIESET